MTTEQIGGSAKVSINDLYAFCTAALTKVGVGEADARTTADVLVMTDTWGVFTHGVKALRRLCPPSAGRRAPRGGEAEGGRRGAGVGDRRRRSGLGMVVSVFAMGVAIAKARACGIGYAGVRNSCHFGAAGYYASLAAVTT